MASSKEWFDFYTDNADSHDQARGSLVAIVRRIQILEGLVEELERRNTLKDHVSQEENAEIRSAETFATETIREMQGARADMPLTFNEAWYLNQYPDVERAIATGVVSSGWQHFTLHGRAEGRLPAPPVKPTR